MIKHCYKLSLISLLLSFFISQAVAQAIDGNVLQKIFDDNSTNLSSRTDFDAMPEVIKLDWAFSALYEEVLSSGLSATDINLIRSAKNGVDFSAKGKRQLEDTCNSAKGVLEEEISGILVGQTLNEVGNVTEEEKSKHYQNPKSPDSVSSGI